MSLLEDLQSLDISTIVNARGSISGAVQSPELQSILSGGAASSALGALGAGLQSIQGSFSGPEALLQPLMQAIEGLGSRFDTSGLPLEALGEAVQEGAGLAGRIFSLVSGNSSDFGQIFGTSLGQVLQYVQEKAGDTGGFLGARADLFADLVRLVDDNAGTRDPRALAELAVEILLPFPKNNLTGLRDGVSLVLTASAEVTLPAGRTAGLLTALGAITAAAERRDAAAVNAAVAQLRAARTNTLATVRNDLLFAIEQIDRLRMPALLDPLVQLGNGLQLGRQGAIEFLNEFRSMLQGVRDEIENLDLDAARDFMRRLPDLIEANARQLIETPINQGVERAKEFVRDLFRYLPIRDLREDLTKFLRDAAQAIEDANLDEPANIARNALQTVADTLNSGGLVAHVQEALQQVNETISGALDNIIAPLETIMGEIDRLAAQAQGILDRLATALADFQTAIDSVRNAIDNLGIEQTEEQIVQSLQNLRQTAEELLSNLPLPEPLRPQVEQLINLLRDIDFDELMEPARSVAEQLQIPPDVAETVESGLQRAKEVIQNLIPAELIASIEAEINDALDMIRNFNPASLLPDVTGYLNQAAEAVERLDPRPIAEQIRPAFQTVLDLIDRAHPRTILAPVIEIYDSVLDRIPVPDAQNVSTGLMQAVDSAGRVVGRTVMEPVRRMDPGSQSEIADPGESTPTAETPPPREEVHPGDAIRLLGYLPAKLRELLSALDAGPAGDAMRELDGLSAGLARQLRGVQAALLDIQRRLDGAFEEMLAQLGPAHLEAQFALQANLAGSANFQVSIDAIAQVGPAALRAELSDSLNAVRAAARRVASHGGGSVGSSIERAAVALESSPLGSLTGNLDQLLAALDPEPIAAELDALVNRILELAPEIMRELLTEARLFVQRLRGLLNLFNPGVQARKFLAVLDVLREDLDLLNPRRLADELGEIHAAIRAIVAAYDPRVLAEELYAVVQAVAAQLRGLDPDVLLGDITFLQEAVDRIAQANPATRLSGIGTSLHEVGERLGAIDLDALIESVNHLGPRLVESFGRTLDAVRNEIVALLESLQYATAGGSASASASVSIG